MSGGSKTKQFIPVILWMWGGIHQQFLKIGVRKWWHHHAAWWRLTYQNFKFSVFLGVFVLKMLCKHFDCNNESFTWLYDGITKILHNTACSISLKIFAWLNWQFNFCLSTFLSDLSGDTFSWAYFFSFHNQLIFVQILMIICQKSLV